jgi:hypothetical protein
MTTGITGVFRVTTWSESCLARHGQSETSNKATTNPSKQVDGKEGTTVLLPFFASSSRLHLLAASASVLFPSSRYCFIGILGPSQDLDSTALGQAIIE